MNSRERVIKTLRFEPVDRVPRDLWALPGVTEQRSAEYRALLERFPTDMGWPGARYGRGKRCSGEPNKVGDYVDAWGCGWSVAEFGVVGEVKHPPLADWSALDAYQPPWELLKDADFSAVNLTCAKADRFMLGGGEVRPFERMQFLRGSENLFLDLAYGSSEVYRLRDMLHGFFMREMETWAATDVDGVSFMDDWGAQHSLLISPEMWRSFYKPLYKDYCDVLHRAGKFVFFHSDGNIEVIYPDLIEIGVNALNSQLFCMDMERLGREYGGKVAFWGEIDRQRILPFGSEDEVRGAVRRAATALMPAGKRTGVFAQCEWGKRDPMQNIATVFEEWEKV
jgi:uroporphyrinogen-III decarboxylase